MGLFNNNPNNRNTDPNPNRPASPAMPSRQNLIIIGLVVLAAIFLLPRLLNTGGDNTNTITPDNNTTNNNGSGVALGDVLVAPNITSDGCATEAVDSFGPNDRVYLVAENSDIPANTDVFGRLYYEGQEVEDSDVITSDRDYTDSCFNVWFESDNGFDSGEYTAQFFINGNAGPEVSFEVQ
jgi:hypothetical protein